MKIAILAVHYAVEVSPAVQGICTYLADRGHTVTLIMDTFHREASFELPGVSIHRLRGPEPLAVTRWRGRHPRWQSKIMRLEQMLAGRRLEDLLRDQDWVFAVEADALDMLLEARTNLARTVFVSLESEQMLEKHRERAQRLKTAVGRCAFCIIQSPERAAGLERYLGASLNCEYLPVSLRPPSTAARRQPVSEGAPVRIVFSGYFADWSCLTEWLEAFKQSGLERQVSVFLHGHAMGTSGYLADIQAQTAGMDSVTLDTRYMTTQAHQTFLAGFDIGLALYRPPASEPPDSANWQNLVFSSGKIAAYAWAGLAVMTNLVGDLTQRPPFLLLAQISPVALVEAVGAFRRAPADYAASALACAGQFYNLDLHMARIADRLKRDPGPSA